MTRTTCENQFYQPRIGNDLYTEVHLMVYTGSIIEFGTIATPLLFLRLAKCGVLMPINLVERGSSRPKEKI